MSHIDDEITHLYGQSPDQAIKDNIETAVSGESLSSQVNEDMLKCILDELKKVSFHLSQMTGMNPNNYDVEDI
jgi:hypothetical protein